MTYFKTCNTMEELKKEYRKLAMANHPDNGGNADTMKAINVSYEAAFNLLKNKHNQTAQNDTTGKSKPMNETAAEYMEIIQKIISFSNIVIEICGSWVWVGGSTFDYKKELKEAGFQWAAKKKMWYWRSEADAVRSRGKMSMDEIREKYGSEAVKTQEPNKVTA